MNTKNLLLFLCLFVPFYAATRNTIEQQTTPLVEHATIINQLTETEKTFFSNHEHQWLFLKKILIDETNNKLKSHFVLFIEAIIVSLIFYWHTLVFDDHQHKLMLLGIPAVILILKFLNEHAIVETCGLNSLHDVLAIHQNPDDFKKYIPEELLTTFDKLFEGKEAALDKNAYFTHQIKTLVSTIYDLIKIKIPSIKLPRETVKEKLIIYTFIYITTVIFCCFHSK